MIFRRHTYVGIEVLDIDVELPGVGEDGMPGRNEQ